MMGIVGNLEDDLAILHRHVRTLCFLAEQAEKSVSAAKRMGMLSDFEMFDELVGEQAYLIKGLIEKLQAASIEENEKMAA